MCDIITCNIATCDGGGREVAFFTRNKQRNASRCYFRVLTCSSKLQCIFAVLVFTETASVRSDGTHVCALFAVSNKVLKYT